MATTSRSLMKRTLLPEGVRAFLKRRISDAWGLSLLSVSALSFLALLSFSPADPSFNTATNHPVQNWVGAIGASFADISLQSVGLAVLIVSLTPGIWGWKVLRRIRVGHLWLRVLFLFVAVILIATGAADFEKRPSWPLTAGYGGAIGDYCLNQLVTIITSQIAVTNSLVAYGSMVLGLTIFLFGASSFTISEITGTAAFLARFLLKLGRSGLSAAEFLSRLCHWRPSRPRTRRPNQRKEPSFRIDDGFGPVLGVAIEDEEPILDDPKPVKSRLIAPRKRKPEASQRASQSRQRTLDLGPAEDFNMPPLELLTAYATDSSEHTDEEALSQNARLLESVLSDFGVQGEVTKVRPGPVVTLYEFEPAPGVKSSRVIGLADDIARSMSAISVRVAVIPGQNVMGIELPNARREIVSLKEVLSSKDYEKPGMQLTLALGKDIGGSPVIADLSRMPHLLIAGTTGSGKSVAINTMILSLLYRLSPEKCRMVMIDPKMLELSVYDGIPHLLCPVVTDPKKAVVALRWTVREMEQRYRSMSNLGVRNVASYNARLSEALKRGETLTRRVHTGFDSDTGEPIYEDQPLETTPLPYIVVVVDEMADLMLVAGKEVEASVQRIAQMARAAGIHLIMATQRPSVDVITGTIKANFPTRVSFQVTSKIDSRTILGEAGAEQLLGQGDMLYMAGGAKLIRVHGPLVTDEEVEAIVNHIKLQASPNYLEEVTSEETESDFATMSGFGGPIGNDDIGKSSEESLYDQAVAIVCRDRKASTSYIQRRLQIGYNRAARLIDKMEEEGVISGANHVGKREVLARDIDDRTR
jgi:S-DNA-T family DNA segregation ATPase FtsK/SpoIIIE